MSSKSTTKDEEPKAEWRELSSFVVEFGIQMSERKRDRHYRTIIHHIEDGETATWQSIAAIEAAQWMENRLVQMLPVREEIIHKRESVRELAIRLSVERLDSDSCAVGKDETDHKNRFLGGVVEDSPIQLVLEVDIPNLVYLESGVKEVPLGIFIHSQSKESVVTLVSRNSILKLPVKNRLSYKFDGLTLPRGFHQIYGMAILYLDKPMIASTDAHVLRVY